MVAANVKKLRAFFVVADRDSPVLLELREQTLEVAVEILQACQSRRGQLQVVGPRCCERSGATMLPAGTVLFSSRAPIGYVAIASNPVSTNQGFKQPFPRTTKFRNLLAKRSRKGDSD